MKCTAHFYLLNDDFSQDYADEHNQGEESELNRMFEWQDELEISSDVDEISIKEYDTFTLQGTLPNGEPFSEQVNDVRLFEIMSGDITVATLACSEVLVDMISKTKKDDEWVLEIYLKDREPFSNPVLGVYIAACDFPQSLIFE